VENADAGVLRGRRDQEVRDLDASVVERSYLSEIAERL
jgi:hypothetical protein